MAERQPEIKVDLTGKGADVRPESFEIRGKKETVDAVLATWAEGGQGPGGRSFRNRLNRTFFRVRTKDGSVYEIAHELPENRKSAARWILFQQLQAAPAEPARQPAPEPAPAPEKKAPARRSTAAKKPAAAAKPGSKPKARAAAAKPRTRTKS